MKYINNPALTNRDILTFVGMVLLDEQDLLGAKPVSLQDIIKCLRLVSRDNDMIVVHSNYNCGLCCYNIFNITDYSFSPLYPTFGKEYSEKWRRFMSVKFPTYKKDLSQYLGTEKK